MSAIDNMSEIQIEEIQKKISDLEDGDAGLTESKLREFERQVEMSLPPPQDDEQGNGIDEYGYT